jgi:hypothetical protein
MMICQEIEHSLILLLRDHSDLECKTDHEAFTDIVADHIQSLESIRRSISQQDNTELNSLLPDIQEVTEVRNRLAHRVIFSPDLSEYLAGKRSYEFEKDLKPLQILHEKIQPLLDNKLGTSEPPMDKDFYNSMAFFYEELERKKAEKRKKTNNGNTPNLCSPSTHEFGSR